MEYSEFCQLVDLLGGCIYFVGAFNGWVHLLGGCIYWVGAFIGWMYLLGGCIYLFIWTGKSYKFGPDIVMNLKKFSAMCRPFNLSVKTHQS